LLIAGLVFAAALFLLRPEATVPVVTASRTLPLGHTIVEADLALVQYPKSLVPEGAFVETTAVIGQTLSVTRSAGDVLYPANLGGEKLVLAPGERAVALQVTDAAGLAGLLKPGDHVGLTAVIFAQEGAFAKNVANGLRVLYVSPDFTALDPLEGAAEPGGSGFSATSSRSRATQGTVVLAISTQVQLLAYDFAPFGVESEARLLNLVDLLPALDNAQNVQLSLVLEPDQPDELITSGVYLPDLVITPGPSPTPTVGIPGALPQATPVPGGQP
jgi:pilus assembly protein CpaB